MIKKIAIITGVTGQDGSHLTDFNQENYDYVKRRAQHLILQE